MPRDIDYFDLDKRRTRPTATIFPTSMYGYQYDAIGNRLEATKDQRTDTYTANDLNQYTQRAVSPAFDVTGEADSTATVALTAGTQIVPTAGRAISLAERSRFQTAMVPSIKTSPSPQ